MRNKQWRGLLLLALSCGFLASCFHPDDFSKMKSPTWQPHAAFPIAKGHLVVSDFLTDSTLSQYLETDANNLLHFKYKGNILKYTVTDDIQQEIGLSDIST